MIFNICHWNKEMPSRRRSARSRSSRSLTKQKIVDSFPAKFTEDLSFTKLSEVKKYYGPYVKRLTPTLANTLVGKNVYALLGQNYWEPETMNDKTKSVSQIKIVGFSDDENTIFKKYKDNEYIMIEDNTYYKSKYPFPAYKCTGKYTNYWSTGSGCDPVYIFKK